MEPAGNRVEPIPCVCPVSRSLVAAERQRSLVELTRRASVNATGRHLDSVARR